MVRMLLVAFRVLVWWPFDSLAQDIDFEMILSGFGMQFGGHRAHSGAWAASQTRIVVQKGDLLKSLVAQLLRRHFLMYF